MKLKNICMAVLLSVAFVSPAMAQQKTNRHASAHKSLIAKQTSPNQKANLKKTSEFIDFSDEEQAPEIDIYTEGWNSKRVNPFTESQVPNSANIDLRGFAFPCKSNRLTSPYGYRAKFKRMHKGVDIGIKMNDTIYAAFDGKVRLTNFEANGYGNYVILRHPNGLETVYGHLNKFLVKPDQTVRAGQPIALGGSTGRSTGPHLHFETRYMGYACNPLAMIDVANKRTYKDTYAFSKSTYTQGPSNKTYAAAPTSTANTYTVKSGDSLTKIAQSYGTTTGALMRLNNLSSENIRVGQVLKIK